MALIVSKIHCQRPLWYKQHNYLILSSLIFSSPLWMQEAGGAAVGVQGASAVTPLYISKLNTVFQLMAVAGFLLHAQTGWPPLAVLDVAAAVTTGTTVMSGAAYVQAFRKGHL